MSACKCTGEEPDCPWSSFIRFENGLLKSDDCLEAVWDELDFNERATLFAYVEKRVHDASAEGERRGRETARHGHRVVMGYEHNAEKELIHGCCWICATPWPCEAERLSSALQWFHDEVIATAVDGNADAADLCMSISIAIKDPRYAPIAAATKEPK